MAEIETISRSYGHYKIVAQIGSGGMGAVYLADDTVLDRKVALKILLAEVAKDKERIRRFILEAKAASALNHPNILTIFEIGEAHGSHYLVTELIKGETLRDLIRKGNRDIAKKIDIGIQAAAALDAAHERGIVHRDIKPENIMVRGDGLVKVLDFGLAKLAKPTDPKESDAATLEHYKTAPGIVVGTAAYMSPEQARGLVLDGRSDAFSLGTVMYELLTGKHPFPGDSHADIVSSILREEPVPVSQLNPAVPKELERIIDRLLRKDRETRYQNFKDLKLDLEDIRDEIRFESKNSQPKSIVVSEPAAAATITDPVNETGYRSAFTSKILVQRRFTLLHALLVGVVGFGVLAGIWSFSRSLFPPPPEPGSYPTSEVAVWSGAAGELSTDARFSPDGKLIAYSSTRSGSLNIWITQTSSSNAIQVTNDEFSNRGPVWSPKGDEIAFFSNRGRNPVNEKTGGLWRVSAFGGPPKLITEVPGHPLPERWSPSGKLYFEMNRNLFAVDVNDGTHVQITSFEPNTLSWIDVSDDEKSIAYLLSKDGVWTIYTSAIDGTNQRVAATGEGTVGNIVWHQVTKQFFYSSKLSGVWQIYRTDSSGDTIRITALETDCDIEDVSPDGKSILITSAKEEIDIWRATLSGKVNPIVKDLDETLWPTVSPDSQQIAFQAIRTMVKGDKLRETSVAVKRVDGAGDASRPRVIAEKGFLPTWSPVTGEIAFLVSMANGDGELMVADSTGSVSARSLARPVAFLGFSVTPYNAQHINAFAWKPDGSSITFPSVRDGVSNLWSADPRSGMDQQITDNTNTKTKLFSPIWSRDGKKLAYFFQTAADQPGQKSTRGVRVLTIDTRVSQEIFKADEIFRLLGWSDDESSLLIGIGVKEFSSQEQPVTISSVSVQDGERKDLAKIENAYFFNFSVSPDRKSIAYAARNDGVDDLWILPASGGTPRKLTANDDPDQLFSRLAWQPDGNAIIFGKQTRFSLLSLITNID